MESKFNDGTWYSFFISLEARIEKLEQKTNVQQGDLNELTDWRRRAVNRTENLENLVNTMTDTQKNLSIMLVKKEPYKCPVCDGRGYVFITFSVDNPSAVNECKSCCKGIIWG